MEFFYTRIYTLGFRHSLNIKEVFRLQSVVLFFSNKT